MDGRIDGVKLDAIDAMPKDAGPRVAEARDLEAGDERRAVRLRALDEPDGTVADRADDLARGVGPFDHHSSQALYNSCQTASGTLRRPKG